MKLNLKVKEPLTDAYPHLQQFKEFSCSDKKLRFVFHLLDEEGDLYKESDIDYRVADAAKKAGITFTNNILDDKEITLAICRYFVINNHHTYELWFSKLVAFSECNFQIRLGIGDAKDPMAAMKTKMQVLELAEELRVDIKKLERQLFTDPISEKVVKESVENRTLHYAEKYAMEQSVI